MRDLNKWPRVAGAALGPLQIVIFISLTRSAALILNLAELGARRKVANGWKSGCSEINVMIPLIHQTDA